MRTNRQSTGQLRLPLQAFQQCTICLKWKCDREMSASCGLLSARVWIQTHKMDQVGSREYFLCIWEKNVRASCGLNLKQEFTDVKVVPLTSVNPCIIGKESVYTFPFHIPFSKYHGNKLDKMFLRWKVTKKSHVLSNGCLGPCSWFSVCQCTTSS